MKKIAAFILSIALLATPFQSTIAFSMKETMSDLFDKLKWEKTFQESLELKEKISPNTQIVISNLKGDITIKTWNRNEVLAKISRKGSESAYDATKVSARLHGDTFTLLTLPVSKDDAKLAEKCTVTYDLLIPKNAVIHSVTTNNGKITINGTNGSVVARSQRGNIDLENISGGARVHTKYGSISIKAQEVDSKHTILAVSEHGNIHVKVPKTLKDANIVARTKKGTVTSELAITTTKTMKINRKTIAQSSKEISGTIGKGGTNIKLETANGNIKLITS